MFAILPILFFSAVEYLSPGYAAAAAILSALFLESASIFPFGIESIGLFGGAVWILWSGKLISREYFPLIIRFLILIPALLFYTSGRVLGALFFASKSSFSFSELMARGGLEVLFNILFLFAFFILFIVIVSGLNVFFSKKENL